MGSSFDAERSDDDLSTALGTETLAERDMVPEGFQDRPNSMAVEVINRAKYMKVDQSANLRANSVSSKIWLHRDEYRSFDDGLFNKHWRCRHCRGNKLFKVSNAGNINTSYIFRHLHNKHSINVREKIGNDEANTSPTILIINTILNLFTGMRAATEAACDGFRALVSVIDAENLRWMLIKWIVSMHIALSVVENRHFRELLVTIAPALEQFVASLDVIIRRWIIKEFEKQSLAIKKKLAKARSKIHISFDL
jgi:hypothetical protein